MYPETTGQKELDTHLHKRSLVYRSSTRSIDVTKFVLRTVANLTAAAGR